MSQKGRAKRFSPNRLRDAMQARNMSNSALAESAKMSESGIRAIKHGRGCPSVDNLLRICFELGISIDDVLTPGSTGARPCA